MLKLGIFALDHQLDIVHDEYICNEILLVMNLSLLAVGQQARHFMYTYSHIAMTRSKSDCGCMAYDCAMERPMKLSLIS
jgi:hypothetical protein